MILKITGRTLLMFCFTLFLLLSLSATEINIAINYYNNALHFYALGNYQQAKKLCHSALEFMPRYSDAYHLLAKLEEHTGGSIPASLGWLKKAVEEDTWQYANQQEAYKQLATLLYRTKEYAPAFKILHQENLQNEPDAEISTLLIMVLDRLGKTKLRDNNINAALKKFPGFRELYILTARTRAAAGDLAGAKQTLAVALTIFPGDTELLYYNLKYTPNPAERLTAFENYLATGGSHAEAGLLALEAGGEDAESYLKFFLDNHGHRDLDLSLRLEAILAENPALQENFPIEQLPAQFRDTNGDGYYEETYQYQDNKLTSFTRDDNQDGSPELTLFFRENLPEKLHHQIADKSITYTYNPYPQVKSIGYAGISDYREYLLVPYSLSYPVLEESDTFKFTISTDLLPMPASRIVGSAYRLNIYRSPGEILLRTRDLQNGQVISEKIDSDNDGVFDHFLEYESNLPLKGQRDFDNDAIFDATEYYQAGKLIRIEFDENNDDKTDATQFFQEDDTTLIYWDYNYDGTYDAKQHQSANKIIYEFSTAADKPFDLVATFIGGTLKQLQREKRELKIIPGPPGIYWIGKKGSALPVLSGNLSGMLSWGKREYFVFRHNNNIYIEEL